MHVHGPLSAPLLAVPNVSEGKDRTTIDRVAAAFVSGGARMLNIHSDADHNRSVFTLSAEPPQLVDAVLAGAAEALQRIDLNTHAGLHPHVGVLDVAPIVYRTADERGPACAAALVLADRLGEELRQPVLLYGELAGGRTRAELRRGGLVTLAGRIAAGELRPDFGPRSVTGEAGVTLVAARPPLIAFNAVLAPTATLADAKAIAAEVRELPGVVAIGLWLMRRGVAQVSMNVEDHTASSPADVLALITRAAPVTECELVGVAPRAAFTSFPEDVPVRNLLFLEDALA